MSRLPAGVSEIDDVITRAVFEHMTVHQPSPICWAEVDESWHTIAAGHAVRLYAQWCDRCYPNERTR